MVGIAASLPYLQLRYLPLGALCLGLLLYDIAADQLGLIAALWAPLLMAFSPWVLDQFALLRLLKAKRSSGGGGQRGNFAGSIYVAHSTHDDDAEAADHALDDADDGKAADHSYDAP